MTLAETRCESRGRILIVGGALECAAVGSELLRARGHELLAAANPEVALLRIGEGHVTAVLCPVVAPGVDGLDLLRRTRALDPGARIPFLMVACPGALESIEACLAAGADDVLRAPADAEDILVRLQVCAARAERDARTQDEVAGLARELSKANARFEVANQRMHRDLRAAARVQRALLPGPQSRVPGADVAWRLRPCEELGGDILNYFRVDEHHLGFYLLDVSGHGAPSAMLSVQVARLMSPMMSVSELLKQRLDHAPWYRVVEPAEAVNQLNGLFRLEESAPRFFTIVYGLLHLQSGRLRLVSAGHPSPIHLPLEGTPSRIPCNGHPVGLFPDLRLDEAELVLAPGDQLWLYSDGISEADDGRGNQFGFERLARTVVQHARSAVDSAVAGVLAEVETWCGPKTPGDDCSLLVIERRAPGAR